MVCPEMPADQQPWLPDEFEVAAVISSGRRCAGDDTIAVCRHRRHTGPI